MTVEMFQQPNGQASIQSPDAILSRIDAILRELTDLRQIVEHYATEAPENDMVAELAGSLGPGSASELEEFNTFDVAWQRFTE
jgi:hypothetical protein